MSAKILVLDPDVGFREALSKALLTNLEGKIQAEIRQDDDYAAALRKVRAGQIPDLVIVAQSPKSRLKPITGSDFCRGLRGIVGNVAMPPVFVLVEENSPLMPAYQAGATDVLLKPIQPLTRLLSKSLVALNQRQKAPEAAPAPRLLNASTLKVACKFRSMAEEGGWLFGSRLILDELGRGGIGVVAKALDLSNGELSALKLLQPEHVHDQEWFARFRREGHVITGIMHPNLVRNKAIGVEGGINYIDMDFVVGTPLNQVIETRGPLSEAEAFGITAQIARGLMALEQAKVVHRDIKPENIMLTDAGHAWLIDFGLSKRAGDAQLTQEGEILGTIAFIAPETISGSDPDILTDIYALGVTLYEMLTGQDLLGQKTTREIFLETLRGKTLQRAAQGLSDESSRIVQKMMAVSRKERYASPAALIKDLEALHPETCKAR